jgi:outer membrane protein OmpA-like peptidoglycan-associated protein
MRTTICALAAGAAMAALGASGAAFAQARTDAYATDSAGRIVKDPFGLCWRTSQWTPAKALAECDPDLVPKPAPRKPEPARAPTAPPLAVAPVPAAPPKAPALPPADSDGDGVPDSQDRCPGTAPGARVDAQGCELDSDRDGVVDRLDKCPGSRPGARVDANGCEIQEVTVLKGVTFATNSATLTPQSMAILDETAATLARNRDVRAEVAGHTDSTGSAARNRALSQQRAESVVRYLVSKGANAANLTARGYGPDQPLADNRIAQGRSQNRRVELRILK